MSIPPASTRHFSSLARRLGRIFAHAYYHHREAFEQAEAESSLYARFLAPFAGTDRKFSAEIIDVSRGGMRVRLLENGAVAFIPAPFIHAVRDELVCSQESGTVQIKGEVAYRVTDVIDVTIAEVRMETRSVVARPAA